MRIIVTGGRDFNDDDLIREAFRAIWADTRDVTIVHGAAPGLDTAAADIAAHEFDWQVEPYPANWRLHGRAAGPIRNQVMVTIGADLVLAFPGGRGTADCVQRAERAGIPVRRIR